MKIGFVLDDTLDKPDGVQQYVLTLGRWFQKQGHEIHYLVGQTKRKDIPGIHSLSRNVHVTFNGNRMSIPLPANKKRLAQLLDQENFDVIHIQTPYSPFLGGRILRRLSQRAVVASTFHILPYSWREKLGTRVLGWFVWRSKRRIDISLGTSQPASDFAKSYFGLKSFPVPNMVSIKEFAGAKPLFDEKEAKITIVFLGRLVERKGCLHLLRALQYLHQAKKLQNVRVIICGKGELEQQAKQFVEKNHLSHLVRFEGFVSEEDKPRYLASADLAVFPSLGGESFGIVLIEAMAAGARVVIAGDNKGYASVMGEHTQQLVDPTNIENFAHTLLHFISNAAARKAAYRWQQKHVHTYDVAVVGGRLLSLYQEAIDKKRHRTHNGS